MPYAIIRAGGHQEKVTPGEQITVDKMKNEVGDEVTFAPLAVSTGDDLVSDRAILKDASVIGKVVQHVKGDKVDVFMYRNKTGYRRHTGHRAQLTLLEISEIRFDGKTYTAPPPEEKVETPAAEAKPKKAAAKKPAAKKAAAKKPAAKKAATKKAPAKK
jgi:large subunit ribosomal protein L21